MATYDLRRFSNPDTLKTIAPQRLLELLLSYKDYFKRRGIALPARVFGPDDLDYAALVQVFLTPDSATPTELNDALYLIHEMATDENADDLLEELESAGVKLDDEQPSPADLAVRAWLTNKEILERKHAEQFMLNHRAYEYYQAKEEDPVLKTPTAKQLRNLEQDLNEWFEKKKRGGGVRVLPFPRPDGTWFTIRHGQLYKRDGSLDAGKPGSVTYRPAHHDVLVFDPAMGEIRIHACSANETELYRTRFGLHLFGSEEFFPGADKYTLEPLRKDGSASVVCDDVKGVDWVRLKEIRYQWGGPKGETETRAADDLFALWDARGRRVPDKARIVHAKFLVKFTDAKIARTVIIRPANVAKYVRDDDAVFLEDFLRKRGFMVAEGTVTATEEYAEAEADLASV